MIDSGATHHITPHASDFKDYTKIKGAVRLGDKSEVAQEGIGSVTIKSSEGYTIMLSNVLHVPSVNTRFVTAKIEVSRKRAAWITSVVVFGINGDYGIVFKGKGLRPRILVNTEGDGTERGQDFQVVGRGCGTQQHAGEGERVDS